MSNTHAYMSNLSPLFFIVRRVFLDDKFETFPLMWKLCVDCDDSIQVISFTLFASGEMFFVAYKKRGFKGFEF